MKKVQPIWIYLVGSLIFFGVLVLFAREVFIPRILNQVEIDKFSVLQKPKETYTDKSKDYIANIATSEGDFTVDLLEKNSPLNVNNFIYLASNNYYDGVYFHRMIPALLIQGGDRNTLNTDANDDGFGKTSYYIDDELNWESLGLSAERITQLESMGFKNKDTIKSAKLEKYSLAMANNGPNTNSAQFFIVLSDSNDTRLAQLNGQFTVIGKITSGQETIDKISEIPVDNPTSNLPRPARKIQILTVKISTK